MASKQSISEEQVRENLRNLKALMPGESQVLYELGRRLEETTILTINPVVFIFQAYATLEQMRRDIFGGDFGTQIKEADKLKELHALRNRLPDISKVVVSEDFGKDVALWKKQIDASPYSL